MRLTGYRPIHSQVISEYRPPSETVAFAASECKAPPEKVAKKLPFRALRKAEDVIVEKLQPWLTQNRSGKPMYMHHLAMAAQAGKWEEKEKELAIVLKSLRKARFPYKDIQLHRAVLIMYFEAELQKLNNDEELRAIIQELSELMQQYCLSNQLFGWLFKGRR